MIQRRFGQWVLLFSIAILTAGCPPESLQLLEESLSAGEPAVSAQIASLETSVSPGGIMWVPPVGTGASTLSLRDPQGAVAEFEFPAGENPYLDATGLIDGQYVYQVMVGPGIDSKTAAIMDAYADDPESREAIVQDITGSTPALGQSGSFVIASGQIVPGDTLAESAGVPVDAEIQNFNKDQVTNDDLVVVGSLCVGMDCVNNENFGFDTVRLKENNLRIKFQDTSVGSFPSTDWQLTANDTASGGQNRFSIEDITAGRIPFTIEGSAPTNSLYVDDGGRIGLGTATPSVEAHLVDGDTPTVRLQQDASAGFTAQTWDLAGNEAGFFVRDVTNGSRLSFRIRPGAPESSIDINANGRVGIGTSAPIHDLHVRRTTATASVGISSLGSNGSPRLNFEAPNGNWSTGILGTTGQFVLTNALDLGSSSNEALKVNFDSLDIAFGRSITAKREVKWGDGTNTVGKLSFAGVGGNPTFVANPNRDIEFWTGTSGNGVNRMSITSGGDVTILGNLTVNGTLSNPSDRNVKDAIELVDPLDVLERVVQMPISSWRYKKEDGSIRHMGPMAQDFMAAFGLGEDERYITTVDADGVSLAAIQGLNKKLDEKDAIIAEQAIAIQALADRIAALEEAARAGN